LPPRNPNFTGRANLLTQLRRNLTSAHAAAVLQAQTVHGLGGVGKTQLAVEYAHRHATDYDLIWWITAEQPAAIPGQLVTLASSASPTWPNRRRWCRGCGGCCALGTAGC
jgi:hypothetical protein